MNKKFCLCFFSLLFIAYSTSANSYKEVFEVVDKWNTLHNTADAEGFKKLYAPLVLYYGKKNTRKYCFNSKRKNLTPGFFQQLITPVKVTFYSSGVAKCDFVKRVHLTKGTYDYEAYLLVKQLDGKYVVCGEGDVITDQRLQTDLNIGEPIGKKSSGGLLYGGLSLLVIGGGFLYVYKRKKRRQEELSWLQEHAPSESPEVGISEEVPVFSTSVVEDLKKSIVEELSENFKSMSSGDLTPQGKGREFENFVVSLFNPEYFTLDEWQSDKFHNGIYPSASLGPDLVYTFQTSSDFGRLAVECKWRCEIPSKGVNIGQQRQLDTYKKFRSDRRMPVFLVLGIGGKPSHPEELYIMPINEVRSTVLRQYELHEYRRTRRGYLYFDNFREVLK